MFYRHHDGIKLNSGIGASCHAAQKRDTPKKRTEGQVLINHKSSARTHHQNQDDIDAVK